MKTESGVRARSDNPRSRGPAPDFRRVQLPPSGKRRPRPARHHQHFIAPGVGRGPCRLVGLDLGLRDRPRLLRIRHHHPRDVRLDQPDDRLRVARRLDRDLTLRPEAVGEDPQRLVGQRDPPGLANQTVLPHRDLRELAVHIQPDTPTSHCSPPTTMADDVGARRANDTYGSALKAHPGESQGRPTTNPRSRRNV